MAKLDLIFSSNSYVKTCQDRVDELTEGMSKKEKFIGSNSSDQPWIHWNQLRMFSSEMKFSCSTFHYNI